MEVEMKAALLAVSICLSALPALAQNQGGNNQGQNNNNQGGGLHAAPAPLLGAGIPAALAIGGVLLGAKFLRRRRDRK
jgi:hypothetical protein